MKKIQAIVTAASKEELEATEVVEMFNNEPFARMPHRLISKVFDNINEQLSERTASLAAVYYLGYINGKRAERQRRSGGVA